MKSLLLCALLFLAGCHKDEPPGPSAEQSSQLNDADAMLNAMAQNEEGPANRSAGPSNPSK